PLQAAESPQDYELPGAEKASIQPENRLSPQQPLKPPPPPIAGLACPCCHAAEVAALPPNGISPNPGYRCLSCEARMRGMTGTLIVAIVIGVALILIGAGLVKVFGDERDASLRGIVSPYFIPIYLIPVIYSVRELFRP